MTLPAFTPINIDMAAADQNALKTLGMQGQNALVGRQTALADQQLDAGIAEKEMRPMKSELEAITYLGEISPMITWENYPQTREWLIEKNKINPAFLPDSSVIAKTAQENGIDPAEYFEEIKQKSMVTLSQRVKELTANAQAANALKPRKIVSWVSPTGQVLNLPEGQAPPEGFVPHEKGGIRVEMDERGNPVITMGGASKSAGGITKKTQGDIEETMLSAGDRLVRLENIMKSYNAKYLQIGTRLGAMVQGWREKVSDIPWLKSLIGAPSTNPKVVKEISEYWEFRQNVVDNLNMQIKWITGAAMNKEEVPRIMAGIPNAGLGIGDGDGVTQFESKLKNTYSTTKATIARYNLYLKQGFTPEQIKNAGDLNKLAPLSEVYGAINQRASELSAQGRTEPEIKQILDQEFYGMTGQQAVMQ